VRFPCVTCRRTTPVRRMGVLVAHTHPSWPSLPRKTTIGSGLHIVLFGGLARRSLNVAACNTSRGHQKFVTLSEGFRNFRHSLACSGSLPAGAVARRVCTRWKRAALVRPARGEPDDLRARAWIRARARTSTRHRSIWPRGFDNLSMLPGTKLHSLRLKRIAKSRGLAQSPARSRSPSRSPSICESSKLYTASVARLKAEGDISSRRLKNSGSAVSGFPPHPTSFTLVEDYSWRAGEIAEPMARDHF